MSNTSLVWFKRDLRVEDHPALAMAAALGPVLPVYIVEPEQWVQPDASARQWHFVAESVAALRDALGVLGQPLTIRMGDAVAVLAKLCAQGQISRIISHEETGNGWSFERDKRVAAWARQSGIEWVELAQCGVVRRLGSRDGWQNMRDAFMRADHLSAPAALPALEDAPQSLNRLPEAKALKLRPDPCPHRQRGGRAAALRAQDSFLSVRGAQYRVQMSSPLSAERACSRLSPYLAHGVLSIREAEHARRAALGGRDGAWRASLSSYAKRLAWRDHFIQKLEDEPALEYRCMHPALEGLRVSDTARLQAWACGETGVPFIDACMRYLQATGWLNFRMRAMLMSFASYHLWLDWRDSGLHLAQLFTDFEPGIHWSQCQMQSGTTGINTLRIYNPVKQGMDHDPDGRFIRRWVPELADMPTAHIHMPWRAPEAGRLLGQRYPAPVVDLELAAKHARERLWQMRKAPEFRVVAGQIVSKHASRAKPVRRRAKPVSTQLSLDL